MGAVPWWASRGGLEAPGETEALGVSSSSPSLSWGSGIREREGPRKPVRGLGELSFPLLGAGRGSGPRRRSWETRAAPP